MNLHHLAELGGGAGARFQNLIPQAAGQLDDVLVFLQLGEERHIVGQVLHPEPGHESLLLLAHKLLELALDLLGIIGQILAVQRETDAAQHGLLVRGRELQGLHLIRHAGLQHKDVAERLHQLRFGKLDRRRGGSSGRNRTRRSGRGLGGRRGRAGRGGHTRDVELDRILRGRGGEQAQADEDCSDVGMEFHFEEVARLGNGPGGFVP